jgi:hypothetical protein
MSSKWLAYCADSLLYSSYSSSIINGSHNLLSDKLISQHKTDCPFSRIPHYTYDDLQKGIICPECHSFLRRYKELNLICEIS